MKNERMTRGDFLKKTAICGAGIAFFGLREEKRNEFMATEGGGWPIPSVTPVPARTPTPTENLNNPVSYFLWRGDQSQPKVALTFDDGYLEEPIVKLTEILKETKTRLTLFIPGQALKAYPKLWRGLDNLGCTFECHSYTHRFDVAKTSVEEITEEIDRSQEALDEILGRHQCFTFYRPAGGAISENIIKALQKRNLKGVIWTFSGQGTSPIATPETVTQRTLSLAGNGCISLHHVIDNDVLALKPILSGLKAKGLSCCLLNEIVS